MDKPGTEAFKRATEIADKLNVAIKNDKGNINFIEI